MEYLWIFAYNIYKNEYNTDYDSETSGRFHVFQSLVKSILIVVLRLTLEMPCFFLQLVGYVFIEDLLPDLFVERRKESCMTNLMIRKVFFRPNQTILFRLRLTNAHHL